ncbi:hypothetical protein FHL15_003139 [Xylaria flabelliformis]|uniref:Uncharacterized protein n=1 Tax=Xylaria flabelliformis TaxID=2512241 RepID=A0A553I732_9PEZI|nr:hypothetical protein FHL15_003139 [Xylaria flabelliformis]
MKSNIKLTVYLTTGIMSEVLAKGLGTMRPAELAGIHEATVIGALLERGAAPSVSQLLLHDFDDVAATAGNNSAEFLYYVRRENNA